MLGLAQNRAQWWTALFQALCFRVFILQSPFLIIKPTRCTNFSNLFWNKTTHVSDSSSIHHQESGTVHTAIVYVINS